MRPLADPRTYLTLNGRVSWPFFVLAAIVVVALALRLHGINWDGGFAYHPDERDIYMRSDCMYALLTDAPHASTCGYVSDQPQAEPGLGGLRYFFDADRSPLNPHWFPLGSILIYVMVFVRSVVELFTDIGGLDMRFAGRTLSALADVGSVLMVFVLGRRLYGRNVGLMAAGLTALAVIHVQHSHFYRPETFTVLLTLSSIWATLRMVERRKLLDSVLLGVILGLALAPKVNVLPLLAPLALGYGYRILDEAEGRWDEITPEILQRVAGHAILGAVVALVVFFITTPYAFIDIGAFVSDVMLQTKMARNAGFFPFTVQYVDTPAFFYQIQQTTVWGLGIPLGVVAWLSIPFTVILLIADRRHFRADLILLAWVIPSLLFLESFEVRFLRYLFPLMPVMILLASRMMLWNLDRAGQPVSRMMDSGREFFVGLKERAIVPLAAVDVALMAVIIGLPIVVIGSTLFYSLAFQRVYANEHPATDAARWVLSDVPRGSRIVLDNHWDEYLPGLYDFQTWQFPLYEHDNSNKMRELSRQLAGSDYLIFYSARPYASAAQDPERFPYSYNYYRLLFSGQLGYKLHREFTNYPSLGGVVFRDEALGRAGLHSPAPEFSSQEANFTLNFGYADDNVSGYDHPRVLVFRNAERRSEGTLSNLLAPPVRPSVPGDSTALMLTPDALEKQRSGGTFSEIANRDGWTSQVPVLAWLLVVELVYLLALPLTFLVMKPLQDKGILLARILGLLLVCWVAWVAVSLGLIDFSRGAVYLGMAVLALASGAVLWYRWREICHFVHLHWRLIAFSEALFLGAFLAFVAIRYFNPDLWHPYRGGEKPMELAYFTAVFKSTVLPPYDPWFAGGYLNYYYWGYFVVACISRVAAIVPATAFNLAVPLFFALTLTAAFSLGYNLAAGVKAEGTRRRWQVFSSAPGTVATERFLPPVLCGLASALFVAVIANIDGLVQYLQGFWTVVVRGEAWLGFDFWRSSRMIPPLDSFEPSFLAFWMPDHIAGDAGASWHITEFPFFTFLFADLHAHMMVIPFTILALGIAMALVAGLRNNGFGWTAIAGAALALTLGSLWAINSWDYPAYLILLTSLTGIAVLFTRRPPKAKLLLFAVLAAGVLIFSVLSFWPFHQNYETFNNGLDPSRWRTPVDRFLAIHGLFLFIIVTYLLTRTWSDLKALVRSSFSSEELPRSMDWLRAVVAVLLVVGLAFAVLGYWNAALMLSVMLLLAVYCWRVLSSPEPARPYEAVVVAIAGMAGLIIIGVDFVTVEGDIGRMNTLFKYYLEVWVFLSIAAAYALWRLASYWRWRPNFRGLAIVWASVLVVLVVSSLIYTFIGTRDRLDDRFLDLPPTLDGARYMANAEHWEREELFTLRWDMEAIEWMQENVEGSPVVLEAHMEQYRWGGRFANYTGLPTIIGWPWHQTQQRFSYRERIEQRASDVKLAYLTRDAETLIEVMRRYGVSYVVVGDLERLNYGEAGLAKFAEMEEAGLLTMVYANEKTSIFRAEFP